MPPPLELTLVLAATRDMGIGCAGGLPWTGLKNEMSYFARVTKRLPVGAPPTAVNAVIMGRKTWDSIPAKFRPLKGRMNYVLSRSSSHPEGEDEKETGVLRAGSLAEALEDLRGQQGRGLGRVFVIGGAQIYDAALRLPEARRVLLTRVDTDFECDAFVEGLRLGEGGGWRRAEGAEFDAWAGEVVPRGVQEENGTRYEFEMWERE